MGIGISLYPEHASFEKNAAYIEEAGKRGFTRVFSCLLSVNDDREVIAREFRDLHDLIHKVGMEVILDVSPAVFSKLGIGYSDLSFFADVHADGIRLDEPFTGGQIAAMTHNPQGLKIELNASSADGTIAATLACAPNRSHLLACHNFYPQRYSGLDTDFFLRESKAVHAAGVRLAAFVGCTDHDSFGPWPLRDGLPTLEAHRDLPLDVAARRLAATGLIDDIIISNCFPTAAELDALAAVDFERVEFRAAPEGEPNETELEILYNFPHQVRGDRSSYLARSSMSRVKYHDATIPARNARDLKRGDIIVVNDADARYKGELQIILRDVPNDGTRNVVASLGEHELPLLDYLDSWTHFGVLKPLKA